ncbi:N-acetylmuramoyl-L-alanine amidase CwlD [Alkaliphilus hydrothermalis]|uniref:N-acetylmuramoyl-L-alanine amidase n=1 Tax=Alkaliphilus hydrothermalis TaxID=1482730 RepID=A0ABS2NQQ0_9FIRM|nr:N-acetylmuramoyl-L-alanine amidase CwlD [Alkaliphilus hydrothermalis]MBM7615265.1 N-acetylmuramoyl-L-alanine amidase [Alkaliphilus hydrothermalis]
MRVIIIRKRWINYGVILAILMTILGILINRYINLSQQTFFIPSTAKTIVIDPGHGGIDPGAIGTGNVYEKDINLHIALCLREYLEQSGSIVVMTREEDTGLYDNTGSIRNKKNQDLKRRKEIVTNANGHVFISIHLNAFPQKQYYGAQTFYPKDSLISKKLAETIQSSLVEVLDPNNKRKAQSKNDIYLIKEIKIPTVLIECGFLSNPQELTKLQNQEYQKKIAWGIYVGVQQYFGEKE